MVLGESALLASLGQIAAIVIALFFFLLIVLLVVLNLLMAFLTSWLREKAELLKLLRPVVESVNTTHDAAQRGVAPDADQNIVVRTVATLPVRLLAVDQKVERASDRVAGTVIEMRARASQAKAIAKAFFLPGLVRRKTSSRVDREGLEFQSPGYRKLMHEAEEAASGAERSSTISSERLKNATIH
jgi:hypothetical protein